MIIQEEIPYEPKHIFQEDEVLAQQRKIKPPSPASKSSQDFCNQSKDTILQSTEFKHYYGIKPDEFVLWNIRRDTEYIKINLLSDEVVFPLKQDIDLKKSMSYNFFEKVYPCAPGISKICDDIIKNPNFAYFTTCNDKNIFFNDDERYGKDPDAKFKACIMLTIAATGEVGSGVELWLNCEDGRKPSPNFGQYVPELDFKIFRELLVVANTKPQHYFVSKRDWTWDVFIPFIKCYNDKRASLMTVTSIIIDEEMIAWTPKSTPLGLLPNITFEPRKPSPLGTMIKNSVCTITGVQVFKNVVMSPELMRERGFVGDPTHLPNKEPVTAATAETLLQIKGSRVVDSGGVARGDAWFGSVQVVVEAKKLFNVDGQYIVKENISMFPKEALTAVMVSRYPVHSEGHWVVMDTTISGVNLIAMVYQWSSKGASYFIMSTGDTSPSKEGYSSHFADEFGNPTSKWLNRPIAAGDYYKVCPAIDEFNRQRQHELHVESTIKTHNPFFKLHLFIIGTAVVDLHRLYMFQEKIDTPAVTKFRDMHVLDFANRLCADLKVIVLNSRNVKRRQTMEPLRPLLLSLVDDSAAAASAAVTAAASAAVSPAKLIPYTSNGYGVPVAGKEATCFICRKYRENAMYTYTMCSHCFTPICSVSRVGLHRLHSCMDEHHFSSDTALRCNKEKKGKFPYKLRLW